jgi:Family of unknown function (DUF5335)
MRTTTQELRADRWARYFVGLAADRDPQLVSVAVIGERPAEQRHGAPWRLQAIGYDPIADVLEVAVGDRGIGEALVLRHFISAPRTITVEQAGLPWPVAILVEDASGARTRIRLVRQAPRLRRPTRPGRAACDASAANRQPKRRPRDRGSNGVDHLR